MLAVNWSSSNNILIKFKKKKHVATQLLLADSKNITNGSQDQYR